MIEKFIFSLHFAHFALPLTIVALDACGAYSSVASLKKVLSLALIRTFDLSVEGSLT